VGENPFLKKAVGKLNCKKLSEADEQLFGKLDEMILQDNRPSPLPLFAIRHDRPEPRRNRT
jgi:hypothetical protein